MDRGGDHPLAELDELAIDHAATVAALALLRDQAVRDSQQAMRGDLLTQLLRSPADYDANTLERARSAGYQVDRPHQALFVTGAPTNAGTAGQLALAAGSLVGRPAGLGLGGGA